MAPSSGAPAGLEVLGEAVVDGNRPASPCLVGRPPCCGGACRLERSSQAPGVHSSSPPPPLPSPHQWAWSSRASRWRCAGYFGKRRGEDRPPDGRCPGFPERVRDVLRDPKGHNLYIADFTAFDDRFVIICSACGAYTIEGRPVNLQTSCDNKFKSDGSRAAWTRVGELKHPSYKHGPAKVLEPALALDLRRSGR